jgi:hypothetical protein
MMAAAAAQQGDAPSWWAAALTWLDAHEAVVWWMFAASLASLLLVVALLPTVVTRLPADYLAAGRDLPSRSPRGLLARLARNVVGWLFLLVGVVLIPLPGQGLLTMLIGLMLVDLPGKRTLERRILGRPLILETINRIRARRGRPPLTLGPR